MLLSLCQYIWCILSKRPVSFSVINRPIVTFTLFATLLALTCVIFCIVHKGFLYGYSIVYCVHIIYALQMHPLQFFCRREVFYFIMCVTDSRKNWCNFWPTKLGSRLCKRSYSDLLILVCFRHCEIRTVAPASHFYLFSTPKSQLTSFHIER